MTEHAPHWWWLSFVDRASAADPAVGPDSPAYGTVALRLGVAIIMATSFREAVQEAWSHRINPGGEVMGQPLLPPDGATAPPGWPFMSLSDRRRFTCRLLQDADATEAQMFLDSAWAALPPPQDPFRGICWDDGYCGHGHHGLAKSIVYGRCRSGKRWFWFAATCDGRRGDDGTYREHCNHPVCVYGGPHEHGWEDTSDAATAAARVAVERLGDGCGVAQRSQAAAADALKRINATRRKMRGQRRAADEAGYLYGTRFHDNWQGPGRWEIVPFPIARKTPQRVYYVRDTTGPHTFYTGEPDLGYVDRRALERDGHVSTSRRWGPESTLYATRELAEELGAS